MHDLYSNSSFLLERTKIEKSFKTSNQLEYAIHIKNLKQALNHGLILKNVHRVIKFNVKTCLKLYIYMNTELRKKIISKKNFSI